MQIISMLSKPEWLHFEFCTTLFFKEKDRMLKSVATSKERGTSSLPQRVTPSRQIVNVLFNLVTNKYFGSSFF